MNKIEDYIGIWRLEPHFSSYEHGQPAIWGEYEISKSGSFYQVGIKWKQKGGDEQKAGYPIYNDGLDHDFLIGSQELVLNSYLDKNGALITLTKNNEQMIAKAVREILDLGRMKITQYIYGEKPNKIIQFYTRS